MGIKGVDLTGQRFSRLSVTAAAPSRIKPNGKIQRYWSCLCDCGLTIEVTTGNLQRGNTKSCGCLRRETTHNRIDLTGESFGSLTVIGRTDSRREHGSVFGYWLCRCVCGETSEFTTSNLRSGARTTCGCRTNRPRSGPTTHGKTGSPTYLSWQSMHRRVADKRPRYGGRGITIDPRWNKFEHFLADMGERPDGTTLDRIDNDGPYSADNCRWATGITQGNNRGNNRWVTHLGRTQTIAQWAREAGLNDNVLYNRIVIYKWPIGRALTEPVHRRRNHS